MHVFDITAKPTYGPEKVIRIVATSAELAMERARVNFRKQNTLINAIVRVDRTIEVYL